MFFVFTSETVYRCPRHEPYCCNLQCCLVKRHTNEIWETWYFWFGIGLTFLFVLTSVTSYLAASCKKKQQNLIRIRNLTNPGSVPVISTISGPGGIIQPDIKHFKNKVGSQVQATAYIGSADVDELSFASPLSPAYPSVQPVKIVKGSAPPQGFRQTNSYTEIVLPPGYVDTGHYKPQI